jgi:hypothetical protein
MTDKQLHQIILVAGAAAVGFLLWQEYKRNKPLTPNQTTASGQGSQSVGAATANGTGGSGSFWDTLGNVGKGLNSGVSSVESTYNNIYDLFGGNSSTAGNPQPVVG